MPNNYFQFRQFKIIQQKSGMKVTTDGCLFGSWIADEILQLASEPKNILDIGAGTGLLSLMVAQVTTDAKITALEINKEAHQESTHNFLQSDWHARMRCIHTSLQDFFPDTDYDLILCNPPFFKNSPQSIKKHKNQAIHAISLSMEDLASHASQLLSENGRFYALYPAREMEEFIPIAETSGLLLTKKIVVRNEMEKPAFRIMGVFDRQENIPTEAEIIIKTSENNYTKECWKLLEPYYLEYNKP